MYGFCPLKALKYKIYSSLQEQILAETVAYIDQLHHKLLDQIHSDGLPPQLIKNGNILDFFK
jgi:hypothetical protein